MRNFSRFFTLIELLVVIAIIAILASMLLPALANARRTAKRVGCISNQKNLSTCSSMYFDEFDEYYPPLYYITTGQTNYNSLYNISAFWFELIGAAPRRISNSAGWGDRHTLKCPAQPGEGGTSIHAICYGLNHPTSTLTDLGGGVSAMLPNHGNHKRDVERFPSFRIIHACTWSATVVTNNSLSDRIRGDWRFSYRSSIAFRHARDVSPVTYLDGHVAVEPETWLMGKEAGYPVLKTTTRLSSMTHTVQAHGRVDFSPYF